MKTRSKRFLNLATLCLALLGTALLMGRPVKASEQAEDDATLVNNSGGEGNEQDHYIREKYKSSLGLSEEAFNQLNGETYHEGRLSGYIHGYKDGQKSTLRTPENSSPYNGPEQGDYKTGYNDGYGSGYGDGWEEAHPVQAFLGFIWSVLSGFFFSSGS
ncbi:TPA: hypothetical protein ACJ7EN_000588 [Streptococcus pyogenes]